MIAFGADGEDRQPAAAMVDRIYAAIDAPRVAVGTSESELLKYACNIFHAVKINFANEIGSMAQAFGADPAAVMQAFCHDTRLNISSAYLKPGFAFGGSCLPKDTRSLNHLARQQGIEVPMIQSVMPSNNAHLMRQRDRILALGRKPTLLAGLTFKRDTDDLRESPMVELAEQLLGKGVPLAIFDPDLLPDELIGANATYIQQRLPHLKLLLRRDLTEALDACEVVIIAKKIDGLSNAALAGKTVVDLTNPKPDVTADAALAKVA
jgi:GDP-mannose 6-dehydrogenase